MPELGVAENLSLLNIDQQLDPGTPNDPIKQLPSVQSHSVECHASLPSQEAALPSRAFARQKRFHFTRFFSNIKEISFAPYLYFWLYSEVLASGRGQTEPTRRRDLCRLQP